MEVDEKLYMEVFKSRSDCFAVQRRDGSYAPMDTEFQEHHVEEHVDGEYTYGQYVVDPDNMVTFAAIDNDVEDEADSIEPALIGAVREKEAAKEMGLSEKQLWLEYSGRRGYHLWMFFEEKIEAWKAKELLDEIIRRATPEDGPLISHGHTEVFPKQTTLSDKGYGNLIKTPWGFHQKTDNRMVFVDEDGEPFDNQTLILKPLVRNRIEPETVDEILDSFLTEEDKEEAKKSPVSSKKPLEKDGDIRPCFKRALDPENSIAPEGDEGHNFLVALVAELVNNGFSDSEIKELFKAFDWNGYDPQTTQDKIDSVRMDSMNPWRCGTLHSKCPNYVTSDGLDLCPECPMNGGFDMERSIRMNYEKYSDTWSKDE